MSESFLRPADKEPPPRPSLITPSASPPVSRRHTSDRPPAPKRPRLSSTPSSSSSSLPASRAATYTDAWSKSLDRLFKSWDQLAERYNKPIDEDDIVDLRDLSILKDRGVTRAAERTYVIGTMVAPPGAGADSGDAANQDAEDPSSADADEEEEDSADELDTLSTIPVPPVPEKYKTWYVPPADETNSEDAEAFREFEEAERRRKELAGLEEEEEEDSGDVDGEDAAPEEGDAKPFVDEDEKDGGFNPESGVAIHHSSSRIPLPKPPRRQKSNPPPKPADDSSEDEFATWEIDETPIPPRRSAPRKEDIIDLTRSRSPSPIPTRGRSTARLSRARSKTPSQPKSKPPQSEPPKSKPPQASLPKAVASSAQRRKTPEPESERSSSPEQVLQLLTPPRSSSAPDSIPEMAYEAPPPPAETPSPKFPKPRTRFTPRPCTPSDDEDELCLPSPAAIHPSSPVPIRIGPPKKAKKEQPPKRVPPPEVYISVTRKELYKSPKAVRASSIEPVDRSTAKRHSSKGKGKERETFAATSGSESESDDLPLASLLARRRSQSQPHPHPSPARDSDSPQPRPPSGRNKRKRVSSPSSLSDSLPAKAATPGPSSRACSPVRRGLPQSKSGHSSDVPPPTSSPVISDAEDERDIRHANQESARTGSPPPLPHHAHILPSYTPRYGDQPSASARSSHPDDRPTPFPVPPQLRDPQAVFAVTEALNTLSYYMSQGAMAPFHPPNPHSGYPSPSGYPPGLPFPSVPWLPYTPSHQRHHTFPSHILDTPSSEAGSSASAMYSTPTHRPHPHPYSYDPRYSGSTLPPSSPFSSSSYATSSPAPASGSILRPASVPPGQRSRSRGRRVSFKLDGHDRPMPPTPPRRVAALPHEYPPMPMSVPSPASASASKGKGKGKARAEPQEEEEHEEHEEQEGDGDGRQQPQLQSQSQSQPKARGRAPPRARTPAPPSLREAQDKGSGSSTSKRKK